MVDEVHLGARQAAMRSERVQHPELLAELTAERLSEEARASRERTEARHQDPLELAVGVLVENDAIERPPLEAAHTQACVDGVSRERRVVLHPRQTLLLLRGDDAPVDDQRGGGVVIVGADAEDRRHYSRQPGAR